MSRVAAVVILCALILFIGVGCGSENVDPDRILQAEKAALEFLGDDCVDLSFTGTREYCGAQMLEFAIRDTAGITVDGENRVTGYKRFDLPGDGEVVITGEDAQLLAEAFVREKYQGFEDKEMLLYRVYLGRVGLDEFDFAWDGNTEFEWTELKYDRGTPNVAKVTVNAFCGIIEAYSATYHIQVPDIEISIEQAQALAVAKFAPRAEARNVELLFDFSPWSLRNQPYIIPYWKVTVRLTNKDGSRHSAQVNIDAVTGKERKHVSTFPYYQ